MQQLSIGCVMFTVPLAVLLVPTGVSSECDKLNADLNDLRTDPNLPTDISARLDNLETYLMRSVTHPGSNDSSADLTGSGRL